MTTASPHVGMSVTGPGSRGWHNRGVQIVCWIGLVLPAGVLQTRDPSAVQNDPFTSVTLFRALFPTLCLFIALYAWRPRCRPEGVREWVLSCYLAVVWLSALWSIAPMLTVLKAAHLTVAYALLVVLARSWQDVNDAISQLRIACICLLLCVLTGAVIAPHEAFRAPTARLVGILPGVEAVVLGALAAASVLVLMATWDAPVLRSRGLHAALAVSALSVLALTRARAPALLMMLSALAYLALQRRRRAVLSSLGLTAGVVSLLATTHAGRGLLNNFWRGGGLHDVVTLSGRLPMWRDALSAAAHSPVLGFGYYAGHRLGRYADLFDARHHTPQPPYVDGTWIESLLDVGLLGCVALAAFVVVSSCLIWRARSACAQSRLQIALAAFFIAYSVQDYTVQQVGIPMVVMAAVLLAPPAVAQFRERDESVMGKR